MKVNQSWHYYLKSSFKDLNKLLTYLELDQHPDFQEIQKMQQAHTQFRLQVPMHFAKLMEKGHPKDPLLLQVLPVADELLEIDGFVKDPLEENEYAVELSNVISKYSNRLLFLPKSNCAVNCRYCFRRHFPYENIESNKSKWMSSFDYIKAATHIEEVILSGGDPLMCNDKEILHIVQELESIEHVNSLRIHTRTPVVIPQRITNELVNVLDNTSLQVVIVLHINHANEISPELVEAIGKLKAIGITIFNQNILLKGVNDNAIVLKQLYTKLFKAGVIPYYLFLLDKVQGASHFYVDPESVKSIYRELQSICSGYLVPKLAVELPREPSKTLVV